MSIKNMTTEPTVNVTENQRLVSGLTGGLLLTLGVFGFGKSSFRRAARMTAGSLLIMRALTGYCPFTALKNSRNQKMNTVTEPVHA
jgi:hypothetical protein